MPEVEDYNFSFRGQYVNLWKIEIFFVSSIQTQRTIFTWRKPGVSEMLLMNEKTSTCWPFNLLACHKTPWQGRTKPHQQPRFIFFLLLTLLELCLVLKQFYWSFWNVSPLCTNSQSILFWSGPSMSHSHTPKHICGGRVGLKEPLSCFVSML